MANDDQGILVPQRELGFLLSSLAIETAHETLKGWQPDDVVHLGDPFGWVLAWLWRSGQAELTVDTFASTLARLRRWDERATKAITLDAVLQGLPLALQGLTAEQQAALIARLRRDVPPHFDSDPNVAE